MHREMDLLRFLTCEHWERKQYFPTIDQVEEIRVVLSTTTDFFIPSLTISLKYCADPTFSFSRKAIDLVKDLANKHDWYATETIIYPRVYQRRGSVLFIYVD